MSENKEKRGIYNVSFNEKEIAPIKSEIELIEDAVISYINDYAFYYIKGYHDERRDKGFSAEHIKLHLESGAEGEININELLDLGKNIRAYLQEFKEPFIDKDNRKIYEWQDKKGIRFRTVVDRIPKKAIEILEKKYQERGSQLPLSTLDEIIITFYSDRNLNERMLFKNPKVKAYYESLEQAIQGDKAMDKLRKEYKERDVRKQSQNKDYLKNKITKKVRI